MLVFRPGASAMSRQRSKPRARFPSLRRPVGVTPLPGPRAVQLSLRPRQGHVQQAPLLRQGSTVGSVSNRHEARFQAADPNGLPLEALGAMEAADGHALGERARGAFFVRKLVVVCRGGRAERDAGAPQDLADHSHLGVGPRKHCHLFPRDTPRRCLSQLSRNSGRLGFLGGEGAQLGERAVRLARTGVGRCLAAEDRRGGGDNLGARTVVFIEVHHLRARPAAGDVGQEARVRPVPAVNGLVGVADDEEILIVPEKCQQEAALERVDVLKLVDEDVAPPPALGCSKTAVRFECTCVAHQQVVEVDEAAPAFFVLVAAVERGDGLGVGGQFPTGGRGGCGKRVGLHQPGLAPLDLARELDDADVGQARPPGHQFAEEPPLALEQSRFGCPPVGPPAAQLAERQGVESPGRYGPSRGQAVQALAQLARRLAGEGDREHVLGPDSTRNDPVPHPAREHPRLAGAR